MKVSAKILDRRYDSSSRCFLAAMSLEDYVNALPTSYRDYDVQREIVSNVYLDHLVDTVLNRRHIPPIVLVIDDADYTLNEEILELRSFKILDGLQRTYRLQAIRKTITFCCEKLDPNEDYLSWSKFQFSRHFSKELHTLDSNTEVLRAVVEVFKRDGKDGLLKAFTENNQWFEIWVGLTPQEEISKMLMLNAGHKPVKTRHQLELLFLNLLPILNNGDGRDFKLVREKDISATQFSKGREIGTFHFAHVITALLSFYAGKPVTPSTGLIESLQNADSDLDSGLKHIEHDVLKSVVAFLVRFDKLLDQQYGESGSLWMGREVSLAGLFGALGAFALESGQNRLEVMSFLYKICEDNPAILNLKQFEIVRNSLDLSKVNIGNINRKAVFYGIKHILENTPPSISDWNTYFGVDKS